MNPARWLFPSLQGYRGEWLRGDVVAGLTVWAVLIPEALAYATIAGVSPVVGLYAAPGALLLYAALGSSRHLVTGPMSATAALSAATVGDLVSGGGADFAAMSAALAIATGVAALLAGLLRLGFLASFISEPVIKGFIIGLALTILIGQVPKLLGVEKEAGDFFEQLWGVITELGDIDGLTLLVGLASLAVVLGLRRVAPAVPGSLVAVALGIAAVELFGLDDHGLEIVGTIESGLPSLGAPDVSLEDYGDLAAGAIGLMLVGFAEGLGAAKTYAARDHYEIDANRELLGLGGANLASGLSSGMVVNGSLSKTAVNGSAGARTQLSGLVVAVLTIVTLLVLTGLFESLPEATLAAIVIAAVIELVDIPALVRLYRVYAGRRRGLSRSRRGPTSSRRWRRCSACSSSTPSRGSSSESGCRCCCSSTAPRARTWRSSGRCPAPRGSGATSRAVPRTGRRRASSSCASTAGSSSPTPTRSAGACAEAAARDDVHAVVLDAETVPYVDVTAAEMLSALAEDLERAGVELVLARDIGSVRDVLRRADVEVERVYPSVSAAVAAVRRRG